MCLDHYYSKKHWNRYLPAGNKYTAYKVMLKDKDIITSWFYDYKWKRGLNKAKLTEDDGSINWEAGFYVFLQKPPYGKGLLEIGYRGHEVFKVQIYKDDILHVGYNVASIPCKSYTWKTKSRRLLVAVVSKLILPSTHPLEV